MTPSLPGHSSSGPGSGRAGVADRSLEVGQGSFPAKDTGPQPASSSPCPHAVCFRATSPVIAESRLTSLATCSGAQAFFSHQSQWLGVFTDFQSLSSHTAESPLKYALACAAQSPWVLEAGREDGLRGYSKFTEPNSRSLPSSPARLHHTLATLSPGLYPHGFSHRTEDRS